MTFLGLPLVIIHSSNASNIDVLLFLSNQLLDTFLEQSSIQLMM